MRHIALLGFAAPPCNGFIKYEPAPQALDRPVPSAPAQRSLPILGQAAPPAPAGEWKCERCGKRWTHEPLPEEAL